MKRQKTPMQPIEWDGKGVIRFRKNKIVRWLLDNGGKDLNEIVVRLQKHEFTQEDYEQFNQLIGYSVSGYGDIGLVSKSSVRKADRKAAKLANEKNE